MAWSLLILAGLIEIVWAVGVKYTDGFSRPWPSLLVATAIAASLFLMSISVRSIPIGTAYAVWVGVGILGTAVFGIVFLGEPLSISRVAFLSLLLISIIGLKLTT